MDIESIKTLLSERHMTFDDLAKKMGKERSVVYKTITNGNPTLNFLLKLSEALNLPIDSIVNPSQTDTITDNNQDGKKTTIDGFVEVDGVTYRIRTSQDLTDICKLLNNTE